MKTEDISVSNEKISCFILHGAGLLLALLTSHDLPCHACKAVTCVFSEPILFYFSLPSFIHTDASYQMFPAQFQFRQIQQYLNNWVQRFSGSSCRLIALLAQCIQDSTVNIAREREKILGSFSKHSVVQMHFGCSSIMLSLPLSLAYHLCPLILLPKTDW